MFSLVVDSSQKRGDRVCKKAQTLVIIHVSFLSHPKAMETNPPCLQYKPPPHPSLLKYNKWLECVKYE